MEANAGFYPIIKFIELHQLFCIAGIFIGGQVVFCFYTCHHIYPEVVDAVAVEFYLYGQSKGNNLYLSGSDGIISSRPVRVLEPVLKCFFGKYKAEGVGAQIKMIIEVLI